ncbi:MAG: PAS domain S-box protein [Alphaproteobacteria bacterium]|nr:PAS domain S-box protein [Alphaproteobacteria bacterium]QQS57221.1 MAG: PAS domain S-box protein [Alphaproteobacteria bacterium]
MNLLFKNLAVAALYYISGRAGLYLASDPAMATIFWPGAGIAMAAVYSCGYAMVPGVYIGAVLVNFTAVYPSSIPELDYTFLRMFLMGGPPALQAFAGAFLIRRVLGSGSRLETFRSVLLFSLLGGPVSCLLSASLSEVILYSFRLMPLSSIPLSWTTWYVGDMLGVLVFAPAGVMLVHESVSRFRKQVVIFPLLLLFTAVISVFQYAIRNEKLNRQEALKADSALIVNTLNNQVSAYIQQIESLRRLFEASDYVSEEEFRVFLKDAFIEYPALAGVFWAPRVSDKDRGDFERRAQSFKGPDFRILDMRADGQVGAVSPRDIYFPLLFAAQSLGGGVQDGVDFASDGALRQRLIESGRTGRPGSYKVEGLFGYEQGSSVVALTFPLYAPGAAAQDPELSLRGFVIGIVLPSKMLQETMKGWDLRGISLSYEDLSKPPSAVGSGTGAEGHIIFRMPESGIRHTESFKMMDETWLLTFSLSKDFLESHVNWGLWYVLAGCFLFTFLLSGFLLVVTGHGAVTESVVEERTRQLKDQTNFLKIIMDHVPDLVFVKNERHEIIAANQAFLGLYAPEDRANVLGRTGLEVFTEEQQELYKAQDRMAFDKGYTEIFESNTAFDGVTRTFFTRKIRFEDAAGLRYMLGLSRDMSDLLTAQSHLESILMTTADGLMVIEQDGRIASFNQACERIFGYVPEDIIGKTIDVLEPPIQTEDKQQNFLHFIRQSDNAEGQRRHELLARRKEGSVFPIYLAASEVKVGGTRFYSAIVRDISVEKKAQEDLRRSNQELEDFAYVASHDLKAPLRHLSLSANFLIRNYAGQLDEKAQELLGIIRKSSERMFEMIDSLLAYSSVGRKDVPMTSVALNEVLEDVLDNLSEVIEASGAKISAGPLPEIQGNRNLMIQLFQNLIENGMKYRKADTAPVIKIGSGSSGRSHLIAVTDNGIGIDPQYKDKIFKIFQRLHSESEYHGTGIGLAICQRIAEFHGGSIELDTQYSEGSRFVIKLPAV